MWTAAGFIFVTLIASVNTEQMGPDGCLRPNIDATYGFQLYRCVKNATGATLAAGSVLDFDSGSNTLVGLAADNAPKLTCAGVVVTAIPDLYWGWVVALGDCLVLSDAAVLVNTQLICESATGLGRVDDTAVAGLEHCIIGLARAAAAGAGVLFRAYINVL